MPSSDCSRFCLYYLDDMDIQLLLILQKVCNQKNIKLPWDEVGEHLGGTITGGAIVQHLAKLRVRRVAQDLPVPDPLKRGGGMPGPALTRVGEAITSASRKSRHGKRPVFLSPATSNQDEEEMPDVDEASDPEASFGEPRAKKSKREAENSEEEYVGSGGSKNKSSELKSKNKSSTKRNGIQSKDTLRVSGTERVARRRHVDSAKLDKDDRDIDTESEGDEPHVAVGSGFLKLEGVNEEESGGEAIHYETESEEAIAIKPKNDSRYSSVVGHSIDSSGTRAAQQLDEEQNVTVLRLGKSERALKFLVSLHSSSSVTESETYHPQSATSGSYTSINDIKRASRQGSGTSSAQVDVNGAGSGNQISNHPNDISGPGDELPIHTIENRASFPYIAGSSYDPMMHNILPPTSMTSKTLAGFSNYAFADNMSLSHGLPYSGAYGTELNPPITGIPPTPISGGYFEETTTFSPGAQAFNFGVPQNSFLSGTFRGDDNSLRPSGFHSHLGQIQENTKESFSDLSSNQKFDSAFTYVAPNNPTGFSASGIVEASSAGASSTGNFSNTALEYLTNLHDPHIGDL